MGSNVEGTMSRPSFVRLSKEALSVSQARNINDETVFNDIHGKPEIAARFLAPGSTKISERSSGVSIVMSEGRISYNGRSMDSGAVIVGEAKGASLELGGLGLMLRTLGDASELGMAGQIRAIEGSRAGRLMNGFGSPLKLIVPEQRENERAWNEEMWDFSVNSNKAIRPVILNKRDRFQFSITDGRGKESYHAHELVTEYFVMLSGQMKISSRATARSIDILEAPFVLAIDAWMSHMTKTDGISYVLQVSSQGHPADNMAVKESREERYHGPGEWDPGYRARDRRMSDPVLRHEWYLQSR